MTAAEARDAALDGEVRAFYLLHADPLRELPEGERWDEALGAASFVVAHEQFLGESADRHADVVFPAESYAEKEGTVTHPDGRLQRLRPAVGHPGEVRAEWQVLVELGGASASTLDRPRERAARSSPRSRSASRLYRGVTLDEIGGRGVRWQEREASSRPPRRTCSGRSPSASPPSRSTAPRAERRRAPARRPGATCGHRGRPSRAPSLRVPAPAAGARC